MSNPFDIRSVNTNSSKLNGDPAQAGKPSTSGTANPGGTKPPRDFTTPATPMPK
jgi:hypothetical protein